jgi:hypothetical protein
MSCSHSPCPRIVWMLQPYRQRLPRHMRPLLLRRAELLWQRGKRKSGYLEQRQRTLQRSPLLATTPRALRRRLPSLRLSLRKSVRPTRHRRGSTMSVSMSSPLYKLGAWRCTLPSSVLLRLDACPKECDLQPSTIMRWSRSLSRFGRGVFYCVVGAQTLAQ